MLLAVEAATGRGWGHLVGLAIGTVIAVLAYGTVQWWREYRGLSPTPPDVDEIDVTPGEPVVSDDDDTGLDTFDDTLPDGRYRMTDGSILVRAWRPPHAGDIDLDLDEPDGLEDEETREEMADRLVVGGGSYADWVRELMGAFDISEATAKRAIRDARDRIDA
jgi:hypothetical protein